MCHSFKVTNPINCNLHTLITAFRMTHSGNSQKIHLRFTGCPLGIDTPPHPGAIELYSLAWRALLTVTGSPSIPHAGQSGWLIQQPINDEIRRC